MFFLQSRVTNTRRGCDLNSTPCRSSINRLCIRVSFVRCVMELFVVLEVLVDNICAAAAATPAALSFWTTDRQQRALGHTLRSPHAFRRVCAACTLLAADDCVRPGGDRTTCRSYLACRSAGYDTSLLVRRIDYYIERSTAQHSTAQHSIA